MLRQSLVLAATLPLLMLFTTTSFAQFPDLRVGPVRVKIANGKPRLGVDLSSGRGSGRGTVRPLPHPVRPTPQPRRQPVVCPPERQVVRRSTPVQEVKRETQQEAEARKVREMVESAKTMFKAKRYELALSKINEVVKLMPENGDVRQFRSLIHVGRTDYAKAAADAYDSLAMGPIWTMSAIKDVYASPSDYKADIEWLEIATADHPDSLAHQFLTSYHALVRGDLKAGEAGLVKVLELHPQEPVATRLLQVVRNEQAGVGSGKEVASSR